MKIGYQRCSTIGQNLDSQESQLIEFGCEKIFSDKITGVAKINERQGLKDAIDFCRAGDQFVCYSISRASRDLKTLLELVETLNAKGVEFVSISEPFLSTSRNNPSSMFVISILGACASLPRARPETRAHRCSLRAPQRQHAAGRSQLWRSQQGLPAGRRRGEWETQLSVCKQSLDSQRGAASPASRATAGAQRCAYTRQVAQASSAASAVSSGRTS